MRSISFHILDKNKSPIENALVTVENKTYKTCEEGLTKSISLFENRFYDVTVSFNNVNIYSKRFKFTPKTQGLKVIETDFEVPEADQQALAFTVSRITPALNGIGFRYEWNWSSQNAIINASVKLTELDGSLVDTKTFSASVAVGNFLGLESNHKYKITCQSALADNPIASANNVQEVTTLAEIPDESPPLPPAPPTPQPSKIYFCKVKIGATWRYYGPFDNPCSDFASNAVEITCEEYEESTGKKVCPEATPPSEPCTGDERKCQDNTLFECFDGEWKPVASCEHGCNTEGTMCNEVPSIPCTDPEGSPDEKKCFDNNMHTCVAGKWESFETCDEGCNEDETACIGKEEEHCDKSWWQNKISDSPTVIFTEDNPLKITQSDGSIKDIFGILKISPEVLEVTRIGKFEKGSDKWNSYERTDDAKLDGWKHGYELRRITCPLDGEVYWIKSACKWIPREEIDEKGCTEWSALFYKNYKNNPETFVEVYNRERPLVLSDRTVYGKLEISPDVISYWRQGSLVDIPDRDVLIRTPEQILLGWEAGYELLPRQLCEKDNSYYAVKLSAIFTETWFDELTIPELSVAEDATISIGLLQEGKLTVVTDNKINVVSVGENIIIRPIHEGESKISLTLETVHATYQHEFFVVIKKSDLLDELSALAFEKLKHFGFRFLKSASVTSLPIVPILVGLWGADKVRTLIEEDEGHVINSFNKLIHGIDLDGVSDWFEIDFQNLKNIIAEKSLDELAEFIGYLLKNNPDYVFKFLELLSRFRFSEAINTGSQDVVFSAPEERERRDQVKNYMETVYGKGYGFDLFGYLSLNIDKWTLSNYVVATDFAYRSMFHLFNLFGEPGKSEIWSFLPEAHEARLRDAWMLSLGRKGTLKLFANLYFGSISSLGIIHKRIADNREALDLSDELWQDIQDKIGSGEISSFSDYGIMLKAYTSPSGLFKFMSEDFHHALYSALGNEWALTPIFKSEHDNAFEFVSAILTSFGIENEEHFMEMNLKISDTESLYTFLDDINLKEYVAIYVLGTGTVWLARKTGAKLGVKAFRDLNVRLGQELKLFGKNFGSMLDNSGRKMAGKNVPTWLKQELDTGNIIIPLRHQMKGATVMGATGFLVKVGTTAMMGALMIAFLDAVIWGPGMVLGYWPENRVKKANQFKMDINGILRKIDSLLIDASKLEKEDSEAVNAIYEQIKFEVINLLGEPTEFLEFKMIDGKEVLDFKEEIAPEYLGFEEITKDLRVPVLGGLFGEYLDHMLKNIGEIWVPLKEVELGGTKFIIPLLLGGETKDLLEGMFRYFMRMYKIFAARTIRVYQMVLSAQSKAVVTPYMIENIKITEIYDADSFQIEVDFNLPEEGETIELREEVDGPIVPHVVSKEDLIAMLRPGSYAVRLVGVDAPEYSIKEGDFINKELNHVGTTAGKESTEWLINYINYNGPKSHDDLNLYIDPHQAFGFYGRILGTIYVGAKKEDGGKNLAIEMLKACKAVPLLIGRNKWVDPVEYKNAFKESGCGQLKRNIAKLKIVSEPSNAKILVTEPKKDLATASRVGLKPLELFTPETLELECPFVEGDKEEFVTIEPISPEKERELIEEAYGLDPTPQQIAEWRDKNARLLKRRTVQRKIKDSGKNYAWYRIGIRVPPIQKGKFDESEWPMNTKPIKLIAGEKHEIQIDVAVV